MRWRGSPCPSFAPGHYRRSRPAAGSLLCATSSFWSGVRWRRARLRSGWCSRARRRASTGLTSPPPTSARRALRWPRASATAPGSSARGAPRWFGARPGSPARAQRSTAAQPPLQRGRSVLGRHRVGRIAPQHVQLRAAGHERGASRLAGWGRADVGAHGEERVLVPGPEMSLGRYLIGAAALVCVLGSVGVGAGAVRRVSPPGAGAAPTPAWPRSSPGARCWSGSWRFSGPWGCSGWYRWSWVRSPLGRR